MDYAAQAPQTARVAELRVPDLRVITKAAPERYTLGVVYEPNVKDAHGDWATVETIRKAAFDFAREHLTRSPELAVALRRAAAEPGQSFAVDVEKIKGVVGDNHSRWDDTLGDLVESYLAPVDMSINAEQVSKGTWLAGIIWSLEMWDKIMKGERVGLSFGAMARMERAA